MALSDSRKKANEKYLGSLDDIKIRVPKGMREVYKTFAASQGKSLNAYVVDLIESDIISHSEKLEKK